MTNRFRGSAAAAVVALLACGPARADFIPLGDLPGGAFISAANGVSADGSIIVGRATTALGDEAFIWDAVNGMRNLRDVLVAQGDDLTGWTLRQATGISADGTTFAGIGTNPSGQTEGWVARLGPTAAIPEPSTLTLVALGALSLLGYRTCRRRRQKRAGATSGAAEPKLMLPSR